MRAEFNLNIRMQRGGAAQRGFTLLELMVVMAIIAVILALILPAIVGARSTSRRIQCMNNLKQIAVAMYNYSATMDNSFPAAAICDKDGNLLDKIPVNAANCCFGGADGHLLFITARSEIWGLKMKTKRVGPQ